MKRARRKDKKQGKKLLIFLTSILVMLAAFVVVLGFHSVLFPIYNTDYVAPVDKASGKANVLILGVDADGMRTDTIILASYDLDNNKIDMLSIPRDTRMYIGKRYQKINAAYSLSQNGKRKGPQGTIEAVTRLTGVPINYYVEFSTEAFRKMIDALGGVEFDVPQRMYYTDRGQNLYIDLQPGLQTLDGDKAEQLVRFRRYAEGDIKRVEMQQEFIKAVAEQKLNLSILAKLPDIFKTLQSEIKTNFSVMDIMKYLPNLKELLPENVVFHQLPGEFSGPEYSASYWLVDVESLKTLITETFGYDATYITTGVSGKVYSGEDRVVPKAPPKPTLSPKPTSSPKPSSSPELDVEIDDEDDYITIPDTEPSPEPTPAPTPSPVETPEPTPDSNEN